jgi:hypothetical protein
MFYHQSNPNDHPFERPLFHGNAILYFDNDIITHLENCHVPDDLVIFDHQNVIEEHLI